MNSKTPGWMYAWRAASVMALAASFFIVPACNDGKAGIPGTSGTNGSNSSSWANDPLSAVVAAFLDPATAIAGKSTTDLAAYVKAVIADPAYADGDAAGTFPVPSSATDVVRTIPGVRHNVVVRWLDNMTFTVPGRVNLVHDAAGAATAAMTITENVAHGSFTVSGLSGGSASTAPAGRLQVVPGYQLVDGDFFTLNDGSGAVVFEFDNSGGVTAGRIPVPFQSSWTGHRVVWAVVDAVNKVAGTLAITASDEPVFGSHSDFLGYFGDGWDTAGAFGAGSPPQWQGSGNSGWLWSNHEYISTNEFPNFDPAVGLAPRGQPLTLAKYMRERGIIDFDPTVDASWTLAAVDLYIRFHKKQLGGSWMHLVRDPGTGEWTVDKNTPGRRFDATSNTLSLLTGQTLNAAGHDDFGNPLAASVIAGTMGNCAGLVTPWGTVMSGEENVQDYYGDFEQWFDGSNQFVANRGLDAGANMTPTFTPSLTSTLGLISDPNGRQERDTLGYNVEIDPKRPSQDFYNRTSAGQGHRKMGSFGRIRWENASLVVDADWRLVDAQPLVMYGTDDRRGGRIFKWVSAAPVTTAMRNDLQANRAAIRTLLDTGKLYVAHFQGVDNKTGWSAAGTTTPFTAAAKGNGKWIELSVTNATDDAPNAAVLGPGTKVGAALMNTGWNNLGGFADDVAVRRALFSACAKIGIFEMNRPEEIVCNPVDGRAYVALTNFSGRPPVLGANGVMGEVVVVPEGASTTTTVAEFVANANFKVFAAAANRAVIAAVRGNQIAATDTLQVNDGTQGATTFTFVKTGPAGALQILAQDSDTAQTVAANIIAAINAVTGGLLAAASGPTNNTAGRRNDTVGRIWTLDDGATPASSATFQFWEVFTGISGTGLFDAANPDNVAVTKDGSVWFGTDGNYGTNGRNDAVYYLDMTKVHPTVVNAQGRAYRILAVPSDAEHTGPVFSSDMKTLFNAVQHPGETVQSTWPNGQP